MTRAPIGAVRAKSERLFLDAGGHGLDLEPRPGGALTVFPYRGEMVAVFCVSSHLEERHPPRTVDADDDGHGR